MQKSSKLKQNKFEMRKKLEKEERKFQIVPKNNSKQKQKSSKLK
jgi:hypothetical protein